MCGIEERDIYVVLKKETRQIEWNLVNILNCANTGEHWHCSFPILPATKSSSPPPRPPRQRQDQTPRGRHGKPREAAQCQRLHSPSSEDHWSLFFRGKRNLGAEERVVAIGPLQHHKPLVRLAHLVGSEWSFLTAMNISHLQVLYLVNALVLDDQAGDLERPAKKIKFLEL